MATDRIPRLQYPHAPIHYQDIVTEGIYDRLHEHFIVYMHEMFKEEI